MNRLTNPRSRWSSAAALLVFAVSLLPLAVSCDPPCPGSCPAAYLFFRLAVAPASDAASLGGVQATLGGATTVTLVCQAAAGKAYCDADGSIPDGSYTLTVSAPGFQTLTVPVSVHLAADARCGCELEEIQPSTVSLAPL